MFARSGRLMLAVAATLVALGAAELGWRTLRTSRFGPTTNPRYAVHDARLGWRYGPDVATRHVSEDFDVAIRTNAQGFRDDPFPSTAGPGSVRPPCIVALGDSQTFGWGVEVEADFPSLLEQSLGVPVLNLGVSGYGTDQELLLWESDGVPFHPAVVILTVCANDTREVARKAMYGRAKPWFTLDEAGPELHGVPVPRVLLTEWSHLARSVWSSRLKAANPPLRDDELAPARRLQTALTQRIARSVSDAGGHLVVVVQDEAWLVEALATSPDVLVVDVGPTLTRASDLEPTRFAHDPHWNAHGHVVVAGVLADAVRARGWLPR